ATLDLLFEAVELFGAMISAIAADDEVDPDRISGYLARLQEGAAAEQRAAEPADALAIFDFPPSILSVLTEYEEHRLLENIRQGRSVFQLQASFDLMMIDTGLER